jgi:multiple sugar transport system permease protein
MTFPQQFSPGRIARRSGFDNLSWALGSYLIAGLYALIVIIPLYFLFVSAFKDNTSIFLNPLGLPARFSLQNFFNAVEQGGLARAVTNSVLITACAELLTLVLAFPAAYAIARIPTRMGTLAEAIFSMGFLIPSLAILMPVFLTAIRLGLLYNPLMLMIFYPATLLSLTVLLLSSQLRAIPKELEESAVIDGASHLELIWYVFLPMARPALITCLLLNFLSVWNEYLFALVLLNSDSRTVQIAVSTLKGERIVDYGLISGGVLISMIPVILLFIFSQEKIMQGMFIGAVKE